jgi:hypothetical protein
VVEMNLDKMIKEIGIDKTRQTIAGRIMGIAFGSIKATEKEINELKRLVETLETYNG